MLSCLHVFTPSRLHILTSSYPHVFTYSRLHLFTSTHFSALTRLPHVFTSSHVSTRLLVSTPLSCPRLDPHLHLYPSSLVSMSLLGSTHLHPSLRPPTLPTVFSASLPGLWGDSVALAVLQSYLGFWGWFGYLCALLG